MSSIQKTETFYIFLVPQSLTLVCVLSTYSASQFGPATSQVLSCHMRPVATRTGLCHSRALEGWTKYLYGPVQPLYDVFLTKEGKFRKRTCSRGTASVTWSKEWSCLRNVYMSHQRALGVSQTSGNYTEKKLFDDTLKSWVYEWGTAQSRPPGPFGAWFLVSVWGLPS